MQGHSPNKSDIAVQCLEALLARPECRKAIWEIPGIIAGSVAWGSSLDYLLISRRLVEILKHKPGPQMSYQIAFCIWLLSFEQNVAEDINKYRLFFSDLNRAHVIC